MHVVTDEQQPPATEKQEKAKAKAPKLTKNQFRAIANKETMINGKAFEDCSRWELFEIIMSLLRNIGNLYKENAALKQKLGAQDDLPIPPEMAEQIIKEVEEILPDGTVPEIEEAEVVEAREEAPQDAG